MLTEGRHPCFDAGRWASCRPFRKLMTGVPSECDSSQSRSREYAALHEHSGFSSHGYCVGSA